MSRLLGLTKNFFPLSRGGERGFFQQTVLIRPIVLVAILMFPTTALALPKSACEVCHPGVAVSSPPHRDLDCTFCHSNIKGVPHQPDPLRELSGSGICSQCHPAQAKAFQESVHAPLECRACHGEAHRILRAQEETSPVSPPKQIETCGGCHASPPELLEGYRKSVHGKGLLLRGLVFAPSCSHCHGSHGILPAANPQSSISHGEEPETCGTCHKYLLNTWIKSSHGQAWKQGRAGPVCTTCHASHKVLEPRAATAWLKFPDTCGNCHQARHETYRDTFHGQATDIGFLTAATCSDCHTPHQQLPAEHPDSSVHASKLGATCGKCHPGVGEGFLTFRSHLDPTDPKQDRRVYAVWLFMTVLLASVFGFFGLHTFLWFQRSAVGFFRGEFEGLRKKEGPYVRRFSPVDIGTHVTIVASFLLLAATGLPLKFHYTDWAKDIASLLGGVGAMRFLHRFAAVVTFGYGFFHLGYLFYRTALQRDFGILWGWRSMVPRGKDFVDLWRNLRYFLYRGPRPQFDRWCYWEKFDYFAVFWGIPVIGLSGLMLWNAGFFTRFLPGWVLNAAFVIHSDEALLAVGYIFLFHFFHTHLRPESFPMDPGIFTGRVPLERFKEERPAEYQRLSESGELYHYLADPPTKRQWRFAYLFGFTALSIGVLLMFAILWTLLVY